MRTELTSRYHSSYQSAAPVPSFMDPACWLKPSVHPVAECMGLEGSPKEGAGAARSQDESLMAAPCAPMVRLPHVLVTIQSKQVQHDPCLRKGRRVVCPAICCSHKMLLVSHKTHWHLACKICTGVPQQQCMGAQACSASSQSRICRAWYNIWRVSDPSRQAQCLSS